jgi:hypothetical protein
VHGASDVDDATVRKRLAVASVVLCVAFAVAMTVVFGMVGSWRLPIAVAAVFVMWVVLFALMVRTIAGPGYSGRPRSPAITGWDLLLMVCNAAGVLIGASGVDAWRGDLPALLVVGLVAAAPLTVAVAVRSWWGSPRVAGARPPDAAE